MDRIEEFLRRRALSTPRGPDSLQYLLRCAETFANRLDPDCGERLSPELFSLVLKVHRGVEEQLAVWRDAPSGYARRERRYTALLAGAETAPESVRLNIETERKLDACLAHFDWGWAWANYLGLTPRRVGFGAAAVLGTVGMWYVVSRRTELLDPYVWARLLGRPVLRVGAAGRVTIERLAAVPWHWAQVRVRPPGRVTLERPI